MDNSSPPIILIIAGHDPSGAAGIQADIESVVANGGRAITLITSLTAQNTGEFQTVIPQKVDDFMLQAKLLFEDIKINACKIGLLGNIDIARAIIELLDEINNIPVVLDPILISGTGTRLVNNNLSAIIKNKLFPRVSIITPNADEARHLSGLDDIDAAAEYLIGTGCNHVLITGAGEMSEHVENRYYTAESSKLFQWPGLDGKYHG